MDYAKFWEEVTNIIHALNAGTLSHRDWDLYRRGLINAIKLLGLWEDYGKWCEENNIFSDPEVDDSALEPYTI